jgi:uncharacterized protein
MKCVKCPGEMVGVRIDDVSVDQCAACGGIWFDALELEPVLRSNDVDALLDAGPRSVGADERRGRCPRCKTDSYLLRIASRAAKVHVDTCAVCGGKWLDRGELELLQQKGLGGRLRRLVDWVLDLDLGR